MYVAVLALVLGQVLVFAGWGLFAYLVVIGIAQGAFVRVYEEPTLRETYGRSYEEFCENVPRWLPRLTPWQGATIALLTGCAVVSDTPPWAELGRQQGRRAQRTATAPWRRASVADRRRGVKLPGGARPWKQACP